MTQDDHFYIRLKCRNCGHTWKEKIQTGYLVEENHGFGATQEGTVVKDAGGRGKTTVERIECPHCKTEEKVRKA